MYLESTIKCNVFCHNRIKPFVGDGGKNEVYDGLRLENTSWCSCYLHSMAVSLRCNLSIIRQEQMRKI